MPSDRHARIAAAIAALSTLSPFSALADQDARATQDEGTPPQEQVADQPDEELDRRIRTILAEILLSQTKQDPEEIELRTIYDDGFYLIGPDDLLKIGGWAQFDFRGFEEGHPGNTEFLVRRARLDLRGVLENDFAYRLYGGYEGSSAKLIEAWLEYRKYPALRVRAGQIKEPFSLEASYSARWIDFVERAMGPTNLAPFEDIGVQVFGTVLDGNIEYAVGVFNGSGRNASETNDDKDVAARISLRPFHDSEKPWMEGLYFGGSATVGQQDASIADLTYRTAARTPFVTFAPGVTHDGLHVRAGAELEWLIGPFGLKSEYILSRREDVGLGAVREDAESRAWYVSLTYLLTGEEQRRNKPVIPKQNFDPAASGWGAWELRVRYEEFDSDEEIFSAGLATGTDRIRVLSGGVTWWPNIHTKAMLDVVFSDFDDDIVVEGQALSDEIVVLMRLQFDF